MSPSKSSSWSASRPQAGTNRPEPGFRSQSRAPRGLTRIGIKEFDIRMKDNEIEVSRVHAEVSFRIER